MKKTVVASLLLVSAAVHAELAPVTHVEPIIRNEPVTVAQNSCNQQPVYSQQHQSSGGVIGAINDTVFGSTGGLVGAVVGGAIGNQIGGGTGREVARIAGVVIGAKMGDDYSRSRQSREIVVGDYHHQSQPVYQTRCMTSYSNQLQQIVVGYNVTYILDGRVRTTALPYNPGSYVNVQRTTVIR